VLVSRWNFARRRPTTAPHSCDTRNRTTWAGAIPAKVLLRDRAIVIAGLANEVDAVNQ
jgi:hypothetical protein